MTNRWSKLVTSPELEEMEEELRSIENRLARLTQDRHWIQAQEAEQLKKYDKINLKGWEVLDQVNEAKDKWPHDFEYEGMNFKVVTEFGEYITVHEGKIYGVAMMHTGEPETIGHTGEMNLIDITAPDEACLATINEKFGTNFTVDQFPGR